MQINLAHLRVQGIDFFVFDANATSGTDSGRGELLAELVAEANRAGLRGSKGALAYTEAGRLRFYGTPDLVRYLAANPSAIRWTHTLDV